MGPIVVGLHLIFLMGCLFLGITGGRADEIDAVLMGFVAVLVLVLGVGIGDRGPSNGEKP